MSISDADRETEGQKGVVSVLATAVLTPNCTYKVPKQSVHMKCIQSAYKVLQTSTNFYKVL